jgi:hypothetical protein
MKRVVLLIFNFLYFINPVYSDKIEWKTQDTLNFRNIKSMQFTNSGDTVVINNGDYLIFIDRVSGTEFKRIISTKIFQYSDDFKFGLSSDPDTIFVYNTFDDVCISKFIKEKINNYSGSNFTFSPDNKFVFQSISFYGYTGGEKGKSEGYINIIDIRTGEIIKRLFHGNEDSLGYVADMIFDKKEKNSLFIAGCFLNVDSLNDIVIKRIYRYDILLDKIDTVYSEYSNHTDYSWYQPYHIFNTNPYGIAKIEYTTIYPSFTIIYPFVATYGKEEGLSIISDAMTNSSTMLIVYHDYTGDNKLKLSRFTCYDNWNIKLFDRSHSKFIDSYDRKFSDRAILSNNNKNDWFALYLAGSTEIIMYSDTLVNSIQSFDNYYTTISPNPASDYIEISGISVILSDAKSRNGVETSVAHPRIFDLLGMEITTPALRATPPYQEGEKVRIDVSSLSPGVYFVQLGNEVRKFVKL